MGPSTGSGTLNFRKSKVPEPVEGPIHMVLTKLFLRDVFAFSGVGFARRDIGQLPVAAVGCASEGFGLHIGNGLAPFARSASRELVSHGVIRHEERDANRLLRRKAAMEKDAAINSPRFDKLAMYDRFDDIREAYGWDLITESEADRLEDLWNEREALKEKTVDGFYQDLVTECLTQGKQFISGLYEDDISEFDTIRIQWEKEREEDEKKRAEMHEDYKAWKNGWGKYHKPEGGDNE